jgi:protein PsiE
MQMATSKWIRHVIQWSQLVMNLSLIAIMLILVLLMMKEVVTIGYLASSAAPQVHDVFVEVVNFFLFFAFVSMIVVYFKEEYHFPLRYLLYIGITATLRFIIINRDNAFQNVLLSIVIVLLIFGYLLLSGPLGKRKPSDG